MSSPTDLPVLEPAASRNALLDRGLRLEAVTIGWNVAEAVIGVGAALASGSVALLAFGLDSVVETASGVIVGHRLWRERRDGASCHAAELDARARRLVAVSLAALAGWVLLRAAWALAHREHPQASPVGIALTAISLVVMLVLARAKRRTAAQLGSRALQADAFQTTACWWLSLVTLTGIGLNAALGWWWADPVAAIAMTPLIASEARAAWKNDDCCGTG